ncbi:MAG: phenylalanine--tRNA ligase subunit alpha [Candidatus Diapherotrites archaeon]|nr:phenylalanine--tRNA ligase subunit alpha [Candidatus Diapherotrites archaeon]
MKIEETAQALSEIERNSLIALRDGRLKNAGQIANSAGMNIDSARRAIMWLKEKALVDLIESAKMHISLTTSGKEALQKGLPEKRAIEAIHKAGGKERLIEIQKNANLGKESDFVLGIAKRNAWVSLHKEGNELVLELTGLEKDLLQGKYASEIALGKIGENEKLSEAENEGLNELIRRGFVERKQIIERSARINELGLEALAFAEKFTERKYVVDAGVPEILLGKKQPYVQFLGNIRNKLVALGFKEMPAPLITQEFYNFDALFQPQGHPARSWSDTYQLKQPKFGKLPDARIVSGVKAAHENGGNTGSSGWQYKWNEEIAKRLMPSAHGTAHSARQLVKGIEIPGKYFAIARCYRPDVVDATHLIEFNQLEGFVVDKSFNFRHLLGMLKQFAVEIAGAEEVKFLPDYYPFTEPSVQLSAKHPELGWIEFAGAGIFRPEMMLPLGIKEPALAWGIGIDRLAMFKLNIKDVRYLFSDDLGWLRKCAVVQ